MLNLNELSGQGLAPESQIEEEVKNQIVTDREPISTPIPKSGAGIVLKCGIILMSVSLVMATIYLILQ